MKTSTSLSQKLIERVGGNISKDTDAQNNTTHPRLVTEEKEFAHPALTPDTLEEEPRSVSYPLPGWLRLCQAFVLCLLFLPNPAENSPFSLQVLISDKHHIPQTWSPGLLPGNPAGSHASILSWPVEFSPSSTFILRKANAH